MQGSANLNLMIKAARKAGRSLVKDYREVENLQVSSKGPGDFVSAADRKAEKTLYEELSKVRPGYGFLMEEAGVVEGADKTHRWIVDPLDGTTNFLHGFPQFCVSIGCRVRGRIDQAVVYDPMRQEVFTASRGDGAHLDNRRMRVSNLRGLDGALIGTGFPYRANTRYLDSYLAMLKDVMLATAGVRRPGSAALDLAYVAAGRTDGFFEIGLGPWDTAAGSLLVEEAGGRVGTLSGGEYTQGGNIIAASPRVYEGLVSLVAPHLTDSLREG